MKKYFFPILTLLASSIAMCAQEVIKVNRVDFDQLRNDWIQMEIELSCSGNPSPDARNRDFVEGIKIKAYLAYESRGSGSSGGFDYYTSEAEIIIMEKGEDNNVYFYLPGLIAERDQLNADPKFYYVEVSVAGETLKPQKFAMSSNIPNLDILNSFVSKADSDGADNEHLLMPIYLVSGIDLGSYSKLPAFLRRDVRD